jgi:GH35 family endo-1,4-beta-xylanase
MNVETVLLATVLAMTCAATAVRAEPIGTVIVPADALAGRSAAGGQADAVRVGAVASTTPAGDAVIEIESTRAVHPEWGAQIVINTAGEIRTGDALLLSVWARSTGEDSASISLIVERNTDPHEKTIVARHAITREWKQLHLRAKASHDLRAGAAQVCVRTASEAQRVQLGGLTLTNFGPAVKVEDLPHTPASYAGREAGAAWRVSANERIEQLRKGDLVVRVTNQAGDPLAKADVTVTMTRHAFAFGTAIDAKLLTAAGNDAERYREIVAAHFNSAVFENDMKWPALWHGVPAHTDAALDWLVQKGLRVRGHTLVWGSWKWLPKELRAHEHDPAALREITAAHINKTVSHFAGKLAQWDVVNEPFSEHDLTDLMGGKAIINEWFAVAHKADPNVTLFVNDYGIFESLGRAGPHVDDFFDTIKHLKDSGAAVGGVGIQSHFQNDLPAPHTLLKTLDRFAVFGLPIESTEVSIVCDDASVQADYMRDYMIALFSHPRVTGITLWGFWEGRHWRPDAALWTRDWTLRPHGRAWLDLVHDTWKTRAKLSTDAAGTASVRGFAGTYTVQVTTADGLSVTKQVTLPTTGARVELVAE